MEPEAGIELRRLLVLHAGGHITVVRDHRHDEDAVPPPGLALESSTAHIEESSDDRVIVESGGHLRVTVFEDFDLEIETDGGHVRIDGGTGEVEVTTRGGHVTMSGSFEDVIVQTGGGHVRIASTLGGSITSGGGTVDVGLRGPGAQLDVYADAMSVVGDSAFVGAAADGHWVGAVGAEDTGQHLSVQTDGRAVIRFTASAGDV